MIFSSGNAIDQPAPTGTPILEVSRHQGELVVVGAISSDANEEILKRTIATNFATDTVTLELSKQPPLPPRWALISEIALASLADFGSFEMTLRPTELSIRGMAPKEESITLLLQHIRQVLPAEIRFQHNLQVVRTGHSFDQLCQKRFVAAIENRAIQFDNSAAGTSTDSHPLLDTLVEIAFDCPHSYFTAVGHSDNTGDESANMAVSLARAKTAIDYMQSQGVPADRLVAVAAGSANPAASNATATGRRNNRRLEFKMEIRIPESNQ